MARGRPKRRAAAPTINPRELAIEAVSLCVATRVRQINRAMVAKYDADLADLGITANQASMLAVIAVLGQPTPKELEAFMLMEASTVSRNVKLMVRNKWLGLLPGQDRRSHHLVISPAGVEILVRAAPAWRKSQAWAKDILGDAGIKEVRRIAKRLNPLIP